MHIYKNKYFSLVALQLVLSLASCSHQPSTMFSSRDITPAEQYHISNYVSSNSDRTPADITEGCTTWVRNFFKPKVTAEAVAAPKAIPLPELTQLNPQKMKFPNGKQYTIYQANKNVMNNYPDYDVFLEQTAEIMFEPTEPFGHIRLRIGKKVYSFNFIQSTSISNFSPRMFAKSTKEDMPNPEGFVFAIDKEKIEAMKAEIEKIYNTSASHNVPPFDAYSPLLKIEQTQNGDSVKLKYITPSPKYGNDQSIKGKILVENGVATLEADNGLRVPLVKKGNDYYTQSYSCSTSASHIFQKFFGIHLSYDGGAKTISKSLSNGNINESISPIAVMRYYEE